MEQHTQYCLCRTLSTPFLRERQEFSVLSPKEHHKNLLDWSILSWNLCGETHSYFSVFVGEAYLAVLRVYSGLWSQESHYWWAQETIIWFQEWNLSQLCARYPTNYGFALALFPLLFSLYTSPQCLVQIFWWWSCSDRHIWSFLWNYHLLTQSHSYPPGLCLSLLNSQLFVVDLSRRFITTSNNTYGSSGMYQDGLLQTYIWLFLPILSII